MSARSESWRYSHDLRAIVIDGSGRSIAWTIESDKAPEIRRAVAMAAAPELFNELVLLVEAVHGQFDHAVISSRALRARQLIQRMERDASKAVADAAGGAT